LFYLGQKFVLAGPSDVTLEEATVFGTSGRDGFPGETTARKITEGYLARIAEIDKKLNAVIELNPDAPDDSRPMRC